MAALPVNIRSIEWQSVLHYVRLRREELYSDAVNLRASRESRDEACARLAELDELLSAPNRTLDDARRREEVPPQQATTGSY